MHGQARVRTYALVEVYVMASLRSGASKGTFLDKLIYCLGVIVQRYGNIRKSVTSLACKPLSHTERRKPQKHGTDDADFKLEHQD